nr:polycystic kidney disease protein 1-like 3 isoform X1 [Procambarus clarkii]
MNRCLEMCLVAMMGVGPTFIVILLVKHYGPLAVGCSFIFGGAYLILVVFGLTLRKCATPQRTHPDQEQPQNDQDSPPSYEAVMAKPPPYTLIYAHTPAPVGGPVGGTPSSDALYQDKRQLESCTWREVEGESAPPSYFEAVRPGSWRCVTLICPPGGLSAAHSPSEVTPAAHSPSEVTPAAHSPSEVTPATHSPSEVTSAAHSPSEVTSAAHSPSEVTPAAHSPSEVTSAAHSPSEVTPAAHSPSEVTPATHSPSEVTPAAHSPSEVTPAAHSPSEVTSAAHSPSEVTPAAHSPSEVTSATHSPSEVTPATHSPSEVTSRPTSPEVTHLPT